MSRPLVHIDETLLASIVDGRRRGESDAAQARRLSKATGAQISKSWVYDKARTIRARLANGEPIVGLQRARIDARDVPPAYALLRSWMRAENMTIAEAASMIGVDRSTITSWRDGNNRPSLPVAVRIEGMTGIPPRDWCHDEYARGQVR